MHFGGILGVGVIGGLISDIFFGSCVAKFWLHRDKSERGSSGELDVDQLQRRARIR